MYRCNREISADVRRRLEVNNIVGVPLHKSFNAAVVDAGGYENLSCIEKDCKNYIEKARRLRLGEGDAAALMSYFVGTQTACPEFFFSIDTDDEGRLRNMFWAVNRSRQTYTEFGDVVAFDTTYLTNKYDMPFAPFVGINYHGHAFIWPFRAWLRCMPGSPPVGIVTDQNRAMQNAINVVFSETKHRWCLWHIMKKNPGKFGGHTRKGAIMDSLHEAVYESQFPEEFEEEWASLIDKYGLENNDWMSGLYLERTRWVPCYLRISFWAGMLTTQRRESMNAFFDGFVHQKTSLKQFVEQYDQAVKSKVEREFQADFRSDSHMVPCATTFAIERQFQAVYTIKKFQELQKELTSMLYCKIISSEYDYVGNNFEVLETITLESGRKKKRTFYVSYVRDTSQVECNCYLFEFKGILCRHSLSVLVDLDIEKVHDRYILRQWRRDVRRAHTRILVGDEGWVRTLEQNRYDQMCKKFAKIADAAAPDEHRTRLIMEWMDNQFSANWMSISSTRHSQ